jgi:hypothetical protein
MMAFPASATRKLSPPVFSLPNKKLKLTPPSPPIPSAGRPPPLGVKEADAPSVFDVLNIFRWRWFLNRDHLIANILSVQKDERGKISWVDFQPQFHTHLIWQALALLPALCPVAKGKRCMFVFVLEVLDGDGPGPYGSGSFFSITKKAGKSRGSGRKSGPPVPLGFVCPPLPPLSKKELKAGKALDRDQAARWPLASATPPALLSPLSALNPSVGPGSSGVSPEFVESWTPMPGLPLVPLAPLNPLPSPITLSQVEDVVATSDMVWELHSRHHPPPSLSSSDSPSSSEMAIDAEDSSVTWSRASSFDPWTETHLAPSIGDSQDAWTTWLDDALRNGVPEFGLAKFIRTLSMTVMSPLARSKFVQLRLKFLCEAASWLGT